MGLILCFLEVTFTGATTVKKDVGCHCYCHIITIEMLCLYEVVCILCILMHLCGSV